MGPPFIWCQKEGPHFRHTGTSTPSIRGPRESPSCLPKIVSPPLHWPKLAVSHQHERQASLSLKVQPLESGNLVQILGSPLTSSGSLSNSLNFPEPQFFLLYNGNAVSLLNLHTWNPEIRRADCTTHFYIRDLNIFAFSVSAGGPGTSPPGIPGDDCTPTYFLGSWWRLNEIIQVRHWAHVRWRVTLTILRRYQIFHLKGLLGNVYTTSFAALTPLFCIIFPLHFSVSLKQSFRLFSISTPTKHFKRLFIIAFEYPRQPRWPSKGKCV